MPSSLADAVREHANNESLLLAEVLLLAVTTAKPAAVTPLPIGVRSGRRRRSVAGVTTLTFYLASDEIALLDTRANATGRNRSHYVSDLLAAWLDNDRRKRVFEPLRNL